MPSPLPMASVPSGLNATAGGTPRGPELVWRVLPTGRPVAGFHSRTVLSPPALARSSPSGLNATPNTPHRALACRVLTRRPVAGFHSRTVPSAPPQASSLPLGLNASARTPHRLVVLALAWRV